MSTQKIVKRYANRKLYDTERSCYVTLEDISIMIKAGDEVRVIDNKSGEDLTSVTFAQIIFEAEKKQSFMSLDLLRGLIRDGGDQLSEFAHKQAQQAQAVAHDLTEKAQKIKVDLEGKITSLTHRDAQAEAAHVQARINELVHTSQKSFEELQRSVEERVKGSVGAVSRYASVGRDMDEIRKRLAELEERLGKLQ